MNTIYDAILWTDGSYHIHGGAAAIIINPKDGKQLVVTGGEMAPTSNQRMELLGAILGLKRLWWRSDVAAAARLRKRKRVVVYSDSAYLVNCFIENWIENWRKLGWRNARGKEVKNREMWETLDALVSQYRSVKFIHVKGHNGTPLNELADQQAVLARISFATRAARSDDEKNKHVEEANRSGKALRGSGAGAALQSVSGRRKSKLRGRRG